MALKRIILTIILLVGVSATLGWVVANAQETQALNSELQALDAKLGAAGEAAVVENVVGPAPAPAPAASAAPAVGSVSAPAAAAAATPAAVAATPPVSADAVEKDDDVAAEKATPKKGKGKSKKKKAKIAALTAVEDDEESVPDEKPETLKGKALTELRAGPIDVLERRIMQDKFHRIPQIQKVLGALTRADYVGALKLLKPLEQRADFKDYFHYLSGQAQLGRMRTAAAKRQWANALLAGEQAVFHLVQVQGANPYTTLEKRAAQALGETEVTMGEVNLKMRKPIRARDLYEKGFQRLSQLNYLGFVPKPAIVSYALLCEKRRTDICLGWVGRLAPIVAKEEARLLERIGLPQKPYIEKTASTTYRVDMDLQAFQKGFQSYVEGKYDEAFVTWSQLLKDYPRTSIKLRTKFWMGRAAQKSNHDAHAETLYREIIAETPFAYYSLLASWFGGIDLSRMIDASIPTGTIDCAGMSPADNVHVRRAEAFLSSGVPELAHMELENVRPTSSMPNEFLVYIATLNHLAGNHLASFQISGELTNRGYKGFYSRYGQTLLFPTTALPMIEKQAREMKVDPLLVLSVIKQESAFNHEAVSGANAYGLMQLISPTARDLDPSVQMADLLTPQKNVRLGAKYISQLLGKYKGNVVPVLAAYNAGPKHSDRWLRESGSSFAPEEYIEQISFRETREYVQNVLRNYYWYSRRVRKEAFPTLGALLQSIQIGVNGTRASLGRGQQMGPPLKVGLEDEAREVAGAKSAAGANGPGVETVSVSTKSARTTKAAMRTKIGTSSRARR